MDSLTGMTVGQRVRYFREHAGMTRVVLGGLVGKSPEWVKSVETGKILTPKLATLLRLAEVLGVEDLADLTGVAKLSTATYTKAAHESLPAVTSALADYPLDLSDVEPVPADELAGRVRQAWDIWHSTRMHRTALAAVLPSLLRDARTSARLLEGTDRRRALRSLAETYHLVQLYLSFQPAQEMVFLSSDRAMTAAQDADDPQAIATAAWYLNHAYRDANEQNEARVELATRAARLLRPEENREDLARWGLLQLAMALSHAKVGKEGDAWRYWDQASGAARALGVDYAHPFLIFGPGMVDAYAVTIHADLMHGGEAVRAAERLNFTAMPSATRRAFHLVETARSYALKREPIAVVHLARRAYQEAPETIRFNLFTRTKISELSERGGSTTRDDARELAGKLGILR